MNSPSLETQKSSTEKTTISSSVKEGSSKKDDKVDLPDPKSAAAGTIHHPLEEVNATDTGNPNAGKDLKPVDNPKPIGSTRVVETPEDAVRAYLRGEVDESEFRALFASTGGSAGTQWKNVDDGFTIKLPEDLKLDGKSPYDDPEWTLKVAAEKANIREAATKASKEVKDDKELVTGDVMAMKRNIAGAEAAQKAVK